MNLSTVIEILAGLDPRFRLYRHRVVKVSNIAIVAQYPKNQPFAVHGLTTTVLPSLVFCVR